MQIPFDIVLVVKYIAAALLAVAIYLAPAWIANQTKKGKDKMQFIRTGSWLFGWTGIGWLLALYWATKK